MFFVIVFTDVYILASAYPELGLGHVTRRGPGDNGDYDECSCTEIRLHSCEEGFTLNIGDLGARGRTYNSD